MTTFTDIFALATGAPDSALKKAIDDAIAKSADAAKSDDATNLARDVSQIQKLYATYGDASRVRENMQQKRDSRPLNRIETENADEKSR